MPFHHLTAQFGVDTRRPNLHRRSWGLLVLQQRLHRAPIPAHIYAEQDIGEGERGQRKRDEYETSCLRGSIERVVVNRCGKRGGGCDNWIWDRGGRDGHEGAACGRAGLRGDYAAVYGRC